MFDIEPQDTSRPAPKPEFRPESKPELKPELKIVDREAPAAPLPASQTLIDAVTQLEANKKDVSPKGFQRRLQLAYAIYDQAALMMSEIETQHAKLVNDLVAVERRTPLAEPGRIRA
jgi:hypothetical protein